MLYMVTFTINIPQNVSIYTSTMDPMGNILGRFRNKHFSNHRASMYKYHQVSTTISIFCLQSSRHWPKNGDINEPKKLASSRKKHTSISTSNPIHQPILFSNIKISRCYYPIIYLCVLKATNGCLTHPAIGK